MWWWRPGKGKKSYLSQEAWGKRIFIGLPLKSPQQKWEKACQKKKTLELKFYWSLGWRRIGLVSQSVHCVQPATCDARKVTQLCIVLIVFQGLRCKNSTSFRTYLEQKKLLGAKYCLPSTPNTFREYLVTFSLSYTFGECERRRIILASYIFCETGIHII